MDVPILVAIISVTGTLLGTIVGGTLTTFGNFLLSRRRERLEFKTACRLVAGELDLSATLLSGPIATHYTWAPDNDLSLKAWEKYESVIASTIGFDAWTLVQDAVGAVHKVNFIMSRHRGKNETGIIGDDAVDLLGRWQGEMEQGSSALRPYSR
jgi:hypothetical protein